MKLQPMALAVASGLAFAIVWAICSAFVVALPSMADAALNGMMHASHSMQGMQVTPSGFMIGLVGWALSAGVTAGILAAIYNAMSGGKKAS